MAIALVAGQTAVATGNSVSSITATLPGATTAGNVVVALSGTYSNNRDVSSVADSNAGDAAATECADNSSAGSPFSRIHVHAYVVTTGAAAQTVTYSGGLGGDGFIACAEFTGLDTTGLLVDAAVAANNLSATSHPTGNLTTTRANTLLCGIYVGGGGQTPSADGAFTTIQRIADIYFAYRIVSSTGAYGFTPTTASGASTHTLIGAVAGAAGGGGTAVPVFVTNLRRQGIL